MPKLDVNYSPREQPIDEQVTEDEDDEDTLDVENIEIIFEEGYIFADQGCCIPQRE